MNHFLDISDIAPADLRHIIDLARKLKHERNEKNAAKPLAGKKLAMIFEKNSTRTRVSFEAGMLELGGHAIYMNGSDTHIGRGEPLSDIARVLSRYVDIIMLRCHSHATLKELARYSSVAVINGLSDHSHPCQIMADIMTYEEHRGAIAGKTVAWIGDGNNVCTSFIHAAVLFGFTLRIACPPELMPDADVLDWARSCSAAPNITHDPLHAAVKADLVVTDTWVSMGDKDAEKRIALLGPYQVDARVMKSANPDALFMHCLPAHRGEEVTAEVIDGPQSVVWDEAENRLHVQKAIMLWCLGK